jgi:hypothetical protein
MTRPLLPPIVVILGISAAAAQEPLSIKEALIARAKSFELDTPYVPCKRRQPVIDRANQAVHITLPS